ncbi:MAG: hypothetical protein ACRDAP_02915 [Shewanella sp.]
MPTGGISVHNINEYLTISRVIACGGSWMVDKKLIAEQRWEEIGRLTREAVTLVE